MILSTIGIKDKISHYQMKFLDHSKNKTGFALDSFDNIKNIKAKNEYDFFKDRILREQIALEKNTSIFSFFSSYFDSIISFITGLSPIIMIYVSLYLLKSKAIKGHEILILFIFIPLLLNSISSLYNIFKDYLACKPYLSTYEEISDIKVENTGTLPIASFDTLETQDILLDLDNKKTIKVPNMKIHKGEKVLIVGESGLGKTTLFNILLGFAKDYQGTLSINGLDIRGLNIRDVRKLIGVSFQNGDLFSFSLEENIALGLDVDFDRIIDLCRLQKVKDKKDPLLNIKELSGGEKARISLAQNLVRGTEVILIDESFSSLDSENERLIMQDILRDYKDKTIICISHKLAMKEYFDRHISFDQQGGRQ